MAMTDWRAWLMNGILAVLSLAFIAGVIFSIEYGTRNSWLLWVENWTSDWRSKILSYRLTGQHPRLAVIKVDEETLKQYPYRIPVDRGLVADLVKVLDRVGAEVIAIDFLFLKATERTKDEALIQAIKTAKTRVVLAVGDSRAHLSNAQQAYQKDFVERSGASAGFTAPLIEADQVVRFIAPPTDKVYPKSFATAAAKPNDKMSDVPHRIAWLLRPKDGNEQFLSIPAHLLVTPAGHLMPSTTLALTALLKGRIVFIGADLIDTDRHLTPLASWEGDDEIARVMLHAQIAAQLLDNREITQTASNVMRLVYALLTACGVCIMLYYGSGVYSVYFYSVTLLIAGVDITLFIFKKQFLPLSTCLIAIFAGLVGGIILLKLVSWLDDLLQKD